MGSMGWKWILPIRSLFTEKYRCRWFSFYWFSNAEAVIVQNQSVFKFGIFGKTIVLISSPTQFSQRFLWSIWSYGHQRQCSSLEYHRHERRFDFACIYSLQREIRCSRVLMSSNLDLLSEWNLSRALVRIYNVTSTALPISPFTPLTTPLPLIMALPSSHTIWVYSQEPLATPYMQLGTVISLDPGSLRWTDTWRVLSMWSYITRPTWLMKKFPGWWVGVMRCLLADRDTYTNACLEIHIRFTHSSMNFLTSKTLPNWSESSQRFISWSNSFIREVIRMKTTTGSTRIATRDAVILVFHGGGAIACIGCCLWNREWIWDNRNSVQLCQMKIRHTLGLKNP